MPHKNREAYLAYQKGYADKRREEKRAYDRKRNKRSDVKEKKQAYDRRYYYANQEKKNAQSLQWAADHPEQRRRTYVKYRYRLDGPEYTAILNSQGGVCAISGLLPNDNKKNKQLSVDHDHTTNLHRGLLHQDINTAIGLFRENPEWLRKAADYLEYWGNHDGRATGAVVSETSTG